MEEKKSETSEAKMIKNVPFYEKYRYNILLSRKIHQSREIWALWREICSKPLEANPDER